MATPQPFARPARLGVGESLDHPEDAGTEAKARLRVRIEPGKLLSVQEEIGIPEVRVNQGIKVNMEASDLLSAGG